MSARVHRTKIGGRRGATTIQITTTVESWGLITSREIADRLHVTRSTISNWKVRYPDFPKPVIRGVYRWPDVKRWLRRHRRAML